MEYIKENWWYLLLIGGFAYMMFKGGGCCGGGHSRSGNDHSGHSDSKGQLNSSHMNNQIEMVLDPVCGMHINPETAIKQNIDGKTYYFCSENCRSTFIKNQKDN